MFTIYGISPESFTGKGSDYLNVTHPDDREGIAPEMLPRIFDPFFTTKFTGRGLGLAAMLGVVQRHKGYVEVFSQPEQGTTIQVFLPTVGGVSAKAAQPVRKTNGSSNMAVPPRPNKRTILVIEDEDTLRDSYLEILDIFGYPTLEAANGKEAMAVFRAHVEEIALALLDVTMPVMSGPETLQAIREIDKEIPVVLLSGYSREQLGEIVTLGNRVDYLQKPFSFEALLEKTQRFVD